MDGRRLVSEAQLERSDVRVRGREYETVWHVHDSAVELVVKADLT